MTSDGLVEKNTELREFVVHIRQFGEDLMLVDDAGAQNIGQALMSTAEDVLRRTK